MKYCNKGCECLIQTGEWDFLDNIKSVIAKRLHFSGHASNEYALEKFRQVKSAEILTNASVELEEELDNILVEKLEEFNANEESEQELQTQKNNISDDPEENLIGKQKKWFVSRLYGGQLTQIHIKRAIKTLLPREYVSRERSHRDIEANYLPGLMPNAKNHNVQKYRFFITQPSTGPQVVKLIFLDSNGKPITSCSSSEQNIKFRAILFVENETGGFNCDSPVKVTRWLNIDRIFSFQFV